MAKISLGKVPQASPGMKGKAHLPASASSGFTIWESGSGLLLNLQSRAVQWGCQTFSEPAKPPKLLLNKLYAARIPTYSDSSNFLETEKSFHI